MKSIRLIVTLYLAVLSIITTTEARAALFSISFFYRVRQALTAVAVFLGCTIAVHGATLQLDGPSAPADPNDWDETSAIQTGNVGGAGIQATLSALHWNSVFQDETGPYASSFFGTLKQPVSSGDFMLIQTAKSFAAFDLTITLIDPLTDPIFYLSDVDWPDAEVSFEPGVNQTVATNGSFTGDVFTSNGTSPGGWAAAYYSGTFGAGSTFTFTFDYSNVTTVGSELVGFAIGTLPPIPIPAALPLMVSGLASIGLLGWRRRQSG